jgi:hypothetical protein
MPFPDGCYDPETLGLMTCALDSAWQEVEQLTADKVVDCTGLRTIMSLRIMTSVRDGERDPERLRATALCAIEGLY